MDTDIPCQVISIHIIYEYVEKKRERRVAYVYVYVSTYQDVEERTVYYRGRAVSFSLSLSLCVDEIDCPRSPRVRRGVKEAISLASYRARAP